MVGGHHGECGARAYNRGLEAEPPVGSRERLRGALPPEAESILVIGCPTEPANLAPVRENSMFCYGPLVSELRGPRVHGAPQPRHWGAGAPPPMLLSTSYACLLASLCVQLLRTLTAMVNNNNNQF